MFTALTNSSGQAGSGSLQQLVAALVGLANSIIPLLLGVAAIVFIWGVIHYLAHPDSPEQRKQMRTYLIMGIIAIAVIISIWGLATTLKNTLFPSAPCPVGVPGCNAPDILKENTDYFQSSPVNNVNNNLNNPVLPGPDYRNT